MGAAGLALSPPSVSEDEALGNILLTASRRRSARSNSSITSFPTNIASSPTPGISALAQTHSSLSAVPPIPATHAHKNAPAHVQHAQATGVGMLASHSQTLSPRRSDDFTTTAPAKLVNPSSQGRVISTTGTFSSEASDIEEASQAVIHRYRTRNIWDSDKTPSAILRSMPIALPTNTSPYFSAEDSAQHIERSISGSASTVFSSGGGSAVLRASISSDEGGGAGSRTRLGVALPRRVPRGAFERVPLPVAGREHDAQFLLDSGSGELRPMSPPKSLSPDGLSVMQRSLSVAGASGENEAVVEAYSSPRLVQPESASSDGNVSLVGWKSDGVMSLLCISCSVFRLWARVTVQHF